MLVLYFNIPTGHTVFYRSCNILIISRNKLKYQYSYSFRRTMGTNHWEAAFNWYIFILIINVNFYQSNHLSQCTAGQLQYVKKNMFKKNICFSVEL